MGWLGFNTAVSGLFGSQRKLYTVNHNVSNADRPGYSRQVVSESSSVPRYLPGIGYIGTGVSITSVDRVRDIYLDKKYRTENGSLGQWQIKEMGLREIEGVLRGSQEEGINVALDEFFKSIEDLSTDPSSTSKRTALREKANTFTVNLNETAKRLYKQQKDINFEVKTQIKEVNNLAEQIKNLNNQIFVMEVDGHQANDLRDQRDLIIDKLSKIVDIEAEERIVNLEESKQKGKVEVKQMEVRIGGISLVSHNMVSKLKYPPTSETNALNPEEPLYKVEWESGGEVKLKNGNLKGLLDIRDGGDKIGDYNGIPYYIDKLNEFARVFAEKINEIHSRGMNLNGKDGMLLFTKDKEATGDIGDPNYLDELYKSIKADNISLSLDILEDLNNIATIDKDKINGDEKDKENNSILLDILKAREDSTFFSGDVAYQGKPEDYLTSILSTLGTDNEQGKRMNSMQSLIVEGTINQRLSVSGVDLDEEMANMIKFQQQYNASARMITTFDEIYNTMINRLGLVGR